MLQNANFCPYLKEDDDDNDDDYEDDGSLFAGKQGNISNGTHHLVLASHISM